MKIVDVAQRTPEWDRWRARGITASESAVILGRSPYKTPWRLWAERTGLARPADLSRNPLVQRGNRLEDAARQWYEHAHDTVLMPICAESEQEPLLRASFDGIDDAGRPVELKVPSARTFHDVQTRGCAADAYRLYAPQVQHQLYVAGAEKGWLVFYLDAQRQAVFEVARDPELIAAIVARGKAFWQAIVDGNEPEKDPVRDLFVPSGSRLREWTVLARRYRAIHGEAKALEADLKHRKADLDEIQTTLVAMMGEALIAESAGLRVTRFCAKGNVDYGALLQALLPELEPDAVERFRRKPSERVRVTVQEDADRAVIPFEEAGITPATEQVTEPVTEQVTEQVAATSFWF
ncbi:MAG: YqaJ viral recombinase family protein [Thiohalocapsa sp.]|nr:YqaJ viral recombinase family protein [Thiohalocapsa sp.]